MMEYIAHRVNTIEELKDLDHSYGLEVDLRDNIDGKVYIAHNPFEDGVDFEEYIKYYQHGTLILNIKSERIESRIIDILKLYKIKDYFFLDSSFPMIKLLSDMGERNIALRFSEYEGMDTIRNMAGKVDWIWIDCFTCLPINTDIYNELKVLGYKLCLVSPELQGQPEKIDIYRQQLIEMGIVVDAVCTKSYNIQMWK